MEIKEERFDLRVPYPGKMEKSKRQAQLMFKLNHTMPRTEEYISKDWINIIIPANKYR